MHQNTIAKKKSPFFGGKIQVYCISFRDDSVPSALLQMDVLSAPYSSSWKTRPYLLIPICARALCSLRPVWVSYLNLYFYISQGQSSVSTQYSKNFGPAGLRLLIHTHSTVLFVGVGSWYYFVTYVGALQNCHLSVVLMVDGPAVDCTLLQIMPVACAFKKVWPPSAGGPN